MTADSGRLNVEYFTQPGTVTYEFAAYLSANRIGHGFTLGFYHKEDLERAVEGFFSQKPGDGNEVEQVKLWIESLPWDENGRMAFSFTW